MIGKQKTDETPKDIVPKLSKIDLDNQKLFKEKLEKVFSSLAPYLDAHRGADTVFGKTFMIERLAPSQGEQFMISLLLLLAISMPGLFGGTMQWKLSAMRHGMNST